MEFFQSSHPISDIPPYLPAGRQDGVANFSISDLLERNVQLNFLLSINSLTSPS